MDVQASSDRLVDPAEKPQEVLMPVTRLAFSDHGPLQHVQRSEQCRRPVSQPEHTDPLGLVLANFGFARVSSSIKGAGLAVVPAPWRGGALLLILPALMRRRAGYT
jgi:hypothetical protein